MPLNDDAASLARLEQLGQRIADASGEAVLVINESDPRRDCRPRAAYCVLVSQADAWELANHYSRLMPARTEEG